MILFFEWDENDRVVDVDDVTKLVSTSQVPITGIIERDEGTTARRLMMDSGTISREERRWLELELGPGEEVCHRVVDELE